MNSYGEEFKFHREKANLSQNKLAQEIGTSQQNINRWEKNEVEPSISFCVKLADFYGITVDELIGRDFPQNKSAPKYHIGTLNNNGKIDMK